MLLRFRVSNFRAFRDPQELSLIAGFLPALDSSVSKSFPDGLLPVAAIYGANASGKTTILRALEFFVDSISDSQRVWQPDQGTPVEPFGLDEKFALKPSSFQLDFLFADTRYQLGFELTTREVVAEWLYSFPNGRRQVWYERKAGQRIRFGKKFIGENRTIEALTRPNSLFISAGAQNNHEVLLPLYSALTNKISFVFGRGDAFTGSLADKCSDTATRDRLARLLAAADLGITGIDLTMERIEMQPELASALDNLMRELAKSSGRTPPEPFKTPAERPLLSLRHKAATTEVALPRASESSGTAAFLALLLPSLDVLASGGVLCVDELDSSLHPLLALEIVRLFSDPVRNPQSAKLIFNTHDVNLLDSSVLRRDEIWFAEKDAEGSAHLYPLSDFKPRKNENLKRGYLQGRYGALPFLSSTDFDGHIG